MFIIINMAKWYHSLTKHHKMEWNKTNSLWHVLPSLFPCILCPFIIVLTQASNIQWPPQGTPNGTTKSSLCCTLTLPTACDAFSADSVIYEYKYLTVLTSVLQVLFHLNNQELPIMEFYLYNTFWIAYHLDNVL